MDEPKHGHTPSQKLVDHETHTAFLVFEVNQGLILISCELCKISENTFFTEHLRVTDSVKTEMLSTPLPWPVRHLSYKRLQLKQHHCNNS